MKKSILYISAIFTLVICLSSLTACKKEESQPSSSNSGTPAPSPAPTPTVLPTPTNQAQSTGTYTYVDENNRTIQFAGLGAANFFGWGAVLSANKKDLLLKFRYQKSQTEVYDIESIISSVNDTIRLGNYSFAGVNQTTPNYGLTITSAYSLQGNQKLFSETKSASSSTTPWYYNGNPIVKTGAINITSRTATRMKGTIKCEMYADMNVSGPSISYGSKLIVDLSFDANYK